MKPSQVFTLVAAALIALNVGCSATVEGGPSPALPNTPPAPQNPQDVSKGQISGTWSTGCVQPPGAQGIYIVQEITFSGDKVTTKGTMHTDAACSNNFGSDEAEGTYKVGAASTFVPGAYEVDYILNHKDGRREESFDLVLIEGDTMYMGTYQGLNAASRPQEIERRLSFKKK